MIRDAEANLVTSRKSQRVLVDDYPFSLEIYRLENDSARTLEVIEHEGTSHAWEEQFQSDTIACDTAVVAVESEGAVVLMRCNIFPIRRLEKVTWSKRSWNETESRVAFQLHDSLVLLGNLPCEYDV